MEKNIEIIKTKYMNSPQRGYSEYFFRTDDARENTSPVPGDRCFMKDGSLWFCWDVGFWTKIGAPVGGETEEIPATDISLSESTLSFDSSANKTLTATLIPSNSTDVVVWTSSDESIAVVSNGIITPISNGSTMITARAGAVSATCEITVNIALGDATTYTITRNITNAIGFDDSTVIGEGSELLECYISDDECTMNGATATVTMGGEDITETAWDNGVVNIAEVTGDVVITLNAVKIQYVVPPVEDFDVQVHEGALLLKSYTGTETAIEIPTALTYNGTEYTVAAGKLKLYSFNPGKTVKHFKCGEMPYLTSRYRFPTYNLEGADYSIRTIDAYGTGLYLGASIPNLERFPVLDCSGKNAINTADNVYMGATGIRTLQGLIYPNTQTDLDWAYKGAVNLIDGGTIPAQITNIKNLFYGCTNLRKVRIEGLEFTDTTGWAQDISKLELECYINSTLFKSRRYNPEIGWTFKDIDGTPINRILCFGDSLSEATYESKLTELCPTNAMVNSLGNGGNTSEQIYQKMVNGTYDKLLKSGVIVIWHGTNGYGVDGSDGVTAKMVEALEGNERYVLIPPTAQGVGDSVYESWVATYGAEHVLSISDWFENNGYTVSEYQYDGTHFNADGYNLVAQAVYEKLQQYL